MVIAGAAQVARNAPEANGAVVAQRTTKRTSRGELARAFTVGIAHRVHIAKVASALVGGAVKGAIGAVPAGVARTCSIVEVAIEAFATPGAHYLSRVWQQRIIPRAYKVAAGSCIEAAAQTRASDGADEGRPAALRAVLTEIPVLAGTAVIVGVVAVARVGVAEALSKGTTDASTAALRSA